jgi:membrane-bound serine protease (ClpP class)
MRKYRRALLGLVLILVGLLLAGCASSATFDDPTGVTFIDRFLAFLVNPNVVYLLLVLGLLAVVAEFATPGAVVPGVSGTLMLILALYGLFRLPTNWLGPVLILTGVAMLLLDIKVTGFALSVGGVIAFLLGSLLMFTPPWSQLPLAAAPVARLNPWLIISTTVGVGLFFILGITAAFRAQLRPVAMGRETLIGKTGVVREPLSPQGIVHIEGEQWSAEAATGEAIPVGARVRVVGFNGLCVQVERELPPGGGPTATSLPPTI